MTRHGKKILFTALAFMIVYPAISLLLAIFFTQPYKKSIGTPPNDWNFPIEEVAFATSDSLRLNGWYLPTEQEEKAIVLLHGYRCTRRQMISRAGLFRENGFSVLLYDARGCGESEGERVSVGYYETRDLLAAIRFLRTRGIEDIACLGISQGGATILMAAEKLRDIRCVVTESAYNNIIDAVDRRYRYYAKIPGSIGAALMIPFAEHLLDFEAERLSPQQHVSKLACPVFIISGTADTRTWEEDTRKLYRAARHPKKLWLVEGADHEDLLAYQSEEYRKRVLSFINKHMN